MFSKDDKIMSILAVFKSRTQTIEFYNALKERGAAAKLVSAPKQAKTGCALACEFPYAFLPSAKKILAAKRYPTFAGFFRAVNIGGRREITRL